MPTDGGTAAGGGGQGGSSLPGACALAPSPARAEGITLEVPFQLAFEGRPFVFGEPNTVSPAQSVVPLNLRFYVSQVELLTAGGGSLPVDVLTKAGAVAPYGVFFFNAEDPDAQAMYLRAPAGSYQGIKFAVDLPAGCNAGGGFGRTYPLSDDSQMTWPHGFGYLFLRYEGAIQSIGPEADGGAPDASGAIPIPGAIHMGGDLRDLTKPSELVARVPGSFSVTAGGAVTKGIQLAVDQMFKGGTSDVDLSDYPLAPLAPPEMVSGERLRRAGPGLPLFVFEP